MNFSMECDSLSITGLDDSFAVCLGSMEEDELVEYVMLQAPLVDEAPDSAGLLYVELNDQSCSSYGGILKCTLTLESLHFILSDSAATELGLEDTNELNIKLCITEEQIEELTFALNEVVFEGRDTLVVK